MGKVATFRGSAIQALHMEQLVWVAAMDAVGRVKTQEMPEPHIRRQ
jgi:predicted pyridoxine 5'-phosphate oxidase superfamily flavin-nucleotide-binding protein